MQKMSSAVGLTLQRWAWITRHLPSNTSNRKGGSFADGKTCVSFVIKHTLFSGVIRVLHSVAMCKGIMPLTSTLYFETGQSFSSHSLTPSLPVAHACQWTSCRHRPCSLPGASPLGWHAVLAGSYPFPLPRPPSQSLSGSGI